MTQKMHDALHALCLADMNTKHKSIDIHARTAWALSKRGYVIVDGASDCMNGNFLLCYLPENTQHLIAEAQHAISRSNNR